ncbi:MAG: class I SAM-dependent methyltransferase [Nitrospirota bacterium]
MKNCLDIDRIAFFGRTYDEYMDIFCLDERSLRQGRVLDCPAGASSFAAEAYLKGIDVTACDIMYGLNTDKLFEKGGQDIRHVFEKFDEASHLYTWGYYKNKETVVSRRKRALELFAHDFTKGLAEGRYVQAELPELPFPDNCFSLVLSGHFLFLYGDRLGLDFHVNALKELVRVCSGTVCVYPLTGLNAKPYARINEVITSMEKTGTSVEIKKTPFEFQRGSGQIMLLSNKDGGERD